MRYPTKNDGLITIHPVIHAKHLIKYVRHHMSNAIAQDCLDFYHLSIISAFILQLLINCIYHYHNANFNFNDMNEHLIKIAIEHTHRYHYTKYSVNHTKNRLIKARILDKNGYLNFNPLFIGNHVNILLDDGTRKEYITYIRVNNNKYENKHSSKIINFNRAKRQLKSNV